MSATQIDAVTLDGAGPLYDQIRRAIRDLILAGTWPPGTAVPAEHALMEKLGASRMTVHRALAQLAREGLILRRRARDDRARAAPASHAMLDILSIPQEVRELGQAYSYRILQRSNGKAPRELAARFELARSANVAHLTLLHFADGAPHVLEDRVIHIATIPQVVGETFAETPPGDWLLQNSLWTQAEHAISAVAAEPQEAELLRIDAGDPCLLVERRTWNQADPITAVRLLYPGGRHRFVGRFGPYGAV
jgi:GntR family transcriptional regulator, histidine utilization repressor